MILLPTPRTEEHVPSIGMILWCFILCNSFLSFVMAQENPPTWMDTTAPEVRIEPSTKWHNSLFYITLHANEPSQLWLGSGSAAKVHKYKRPISVAGDGKYRYFFYGEDDFGNKSVVDSMEYVLDTRSPQITISPDPGVYQKNTMIKITTNEPCRLFLLAKKDEIGGMVIPDSFPFQETINGYFAAVDSAGNRTVSDRISFNLDISGKTAIAGSSLKIDPPEGIYNVRKQVTISAPAGIDLYYTFDPLAPPEWFGKYAEPFILPHGLTIVRYFGKSASGLTSGIQKISYIIDTIPPKVYARSTAGTASDTLYLSCKEATDIRFTTNGTIPTLSSSRYSAPLVIPREGMSRIRAKAWDRAGNSSAVVTWESKYDTIPPSITAQPAGGTYRYPVTVTLIPNETAKVLYSLDSTDTNISLVYSPGGIILSRQGRVKLRFRGIDAADNVSPVTTEWYTIDSKPPEIDEVVGSDIAGNKFRVSLFCREKIVIYYTVNAGEPTSQSPQYTGPVELKSGDVLSYFGVDSVGNTTSIRTMDDLKKPLIEANPPAGVYNKRLQIDFDRNVTGSVWWRLLPDTVFREAKTSIPIDKEGMYTFEYFLQTQSGARSALRRNEYVLDWTPPDVSIRIQKGVDDSAIVFFNATENASIYYTTDGSNPLFSPTTRTAGNRLQRSFDRISLKRNLDMRMAFYAEDAAGNQNALKILDVFRPHVIPNVPAGADRIHDRILSITLQSQEGSVIHYLRHGKTPTVQSPIFSEPINLSISDTIVAFVVDASGYQGELESFIYLIDLPPSPQFTVYPETLYTDTEVRFDAQGTLDRESDFKKLRFRWDFNGDDKYDTDSAFLPAVKHTYKTPGIYTVVLEVFDERQHSAIFRKDLFVRDHCPSDMVPAFDADGSSFCIDKYEWPNKPGTDPDVNVSWVEAKMSCIDAGKRLCSESEWISACNNNSQSMYPYGDHYDEKRCATEKKGVEKSGSNPGCMAGGISDMVGNVWEWIENKHDDLTQAYGGSFRYGKDAHCRLKFEGTVASRSDETGFRCCK